MKRKIILTIILSLLSTDLTYSAKEIKKRNPNKIPLQKVSYSHLENFTGTLLLPNKKPPYPAIIYSYDEFYEIAGIDGAFQQGYDIEKIMRKFQEWGFAVLVPKRRHHKPKSIIGAIHYLRNRKDIQNDGINLIGVSQGGFLSLIAAIKEPEIASLTLLTPKAIHDSGIFSLPGLNRELIKLKTSTLMIVGNESPNNDVMSSRRIRKLMVLKNRELKYKEYHVNKRWFWETDKAYMKDIKTFLYQRLKYPIPKNPILDTRG